MASEILEVSIKLDTGEVKKGFISIEQDAKKAGAAAGSGLGDGFSKGQAALVTLNAGLGVVKDTLEVIKKVNEAAFDFARAGEEIAAIGKRFEIIAGQAGLVPERISAGIEKAVGGTVDMEDALAKATESMIELGGNAERLPELFELARKASSVFGGDTISRVDQLSASIASGNTKALRGIGLQIDATQVNKKYADALGVSAGFLSKEQQQQALLNAVLEKGNQKFKDINESITPLDTSSKKLTVAFKELGDTGATAFNNTFGAAIKRSIDESARSLEVFNIKLSEFLLGKVPSAAENVKLLSNEIRNLIKSQDSAYRLGDTDRVEQINREIDGLRQQILVQKQLDNQKATSDAVAKSKASGTGGANVAKLTFDQQEIIRKLTLSGEQALSVSLKANLDLRKQDSETYFSDIQNINRNHDDSLTAENLRFISEKKALDEQYKDIAGTDLFHQIVEQKEQQHAANKLAIERQFVADSRQANASFSDGFKKGFEDIGKANQTFKTGLVELGAATKTVLVTGIGNAFSKVGEALVKGKNAFAAFGGAILQMLAGVAAQMGQFFIAMGIGFLFVDPARGAGLIAAGIGLSLLGGILGALGGGSDDSGASSGAVGGGITASPSASSGFQTPSYLEPQKAQTVINLNVEGSVFDTSDTGRRFVDILHDHFASTGATLPSGMVPA